MTNRILMLDEAVMSIVAFSLEEALNVKVDLAEDIDSARKLRQENSYNAFIVEPFIYLGDCLKENGRPMLEFIREVKQENVPVIITSTSSIWSLQRDGLKDEDYNHYFGKPFDNLKLEALLCDMFDIKRPCYLNMLLGADYKIKKDDVGY